MSIPFPIVRRYSVPKNLHARITNSILNPDMWPAMQDAEAILQEAENYSGAIKESAQLEANTILNNAKHRIAQEMLEARLQAQKDVWSSVLSDWQLFTEKLNNSRLNAEKISVSLIKIIVDKLKLQLTIEEKLISNMRLLLEKKLRNSECELRVNPQRVGLLNKILSDHLINFSVLADSKVADDAVLLYHGGITFEVSFDDNMKLIQQALEKISENHLTTSEESKQ